MRTSIVIITIIVIYLYKHCTAFLIILSFSIFYCYYYVVLAAIGSCTGPADRKSNAHRQRST